MKKLMLVAALMLMSVGVFAQGKVAIGANAGVALYGDGYNPFGFGAKLQYEFVENVRAELGYNYWLPKDKAGLMDFNLNLQYLIPLSDNVNIYPMVGGNLAMTHGDAVKALFDKQQTIFGFQGGLGIEFYVAENVKLNVDAKYQYNKKTKEFTDRGTIHKFEMKYNGPVFMAGIAYVF